MSVDVSITHGYEALKILRYYRTEETLMDFSREKEKLFEIIEAVKSKYFTGENNTDNIISQKGEYDLVTALDIDIEDFIIHSIQNSFPNDSIISEETRNHPVIKERSWVIDPIDGTCNLANGIPIYGVQMAFMYRSEPILSVIYHPILKELFYAEKGKGAYLNDRRISVKRDIPIKQAIISMGDFSKSNTCAVRTQFCIMKNINGKILKLRMWGAACFDLAYLAAGRIHGHIMFSKNIWDIVPGLFLAQEAGAVIAGMDGGKYDMQEGVLIAACQSSIVDLIVENADEGKTYE